MLTQLQNTVMELMLLDVPDRVICQRLGISASSLSHVRERIQQGGRWRPEDELPDERPSEDGKLPPDTARFCVACEQSACTCK
jgi:hypothetical protein